MIVAEIPLRTVPGKNAREHFHAKARRVKAEKQAVGLVLNTRKELRPTPPCEVLLVRISPGHTPLDDDNLVEALCNVRDAVAAWIGIDDGSPLVRYRCEQEWGPFGWGVQIHVSSL